MDKQIVKENLIAVMKELGIKGDVNSNENSELAALGIDSIDAMNIIVNLEDKMNVKLEDDELMKLKTVKDLLDAFASK
jgi:acyl carrier protein